MFTMRGAGAAMRGVTTSVQSIRARTWKKNARYLIIMVFAPEKNRLRFNRHSGSRARLYGYGRAISSSTIPKFPVLFFRQTFETQRVENFTQVPDHASHGIADFNRGGVHLCIAFGQCPEGYPQA